MTKSSRRQVVPKTKSDIIIRWKEIEKEFSFAGFFSVDPFVGHMRRLRLNNFALLAGKAKQGEHELSDAIGSGAIKRFLVLAIFRDSNHDVWRNRRSTVSRVNYRCCRGMISLQLPKHTACINHLINIFLRSVLLQVTAHFAPTFNRPLCIAAWVKEKKNYAVMFSLMTFGCNVENKLLWSSGAKDEKRRESVQCPTIKTGRLDDYGPARLLVIIPDDRSFSSLAN